MSRETLAEVDELLDECGGRVAVATLRRGFRDVPRARLEVAARDWRRRHAATTELLTWNTPGAVWAADWTEPQPAIEGLGGGACRRMLVVRDLASHMQLMALPAERATAEVAAAAIGSLVAAHGAPLVAKTDNGSNVAGAEVAEMLGRCAIVHLRSPARTPRYNGAVEAGIGSMKVRLHHIAAANGRAAHPTLDDVEAARLEANAQARPWGAGGPSPDERWSSRTAITEDQRRAFADAVGAAMVEEARSLLALRGARAGADARQAAAPGDAPAAPPASPGAQPRAAADSLLNNAPASAMLAPAEPDVDPLVNLGAHDRATVARRAIRRALEALGHLTARRTAHSSTDLDAESGRN